MVVTNLNVEPGGYGTRSALSMNGLRGSSSRNLASALVRWPVMTLGSNDGLHQGQDLAGRDLDHRHRRRRVRRHRALGDALQIGVEGQDQAVAGDRLGDAVAAIRPAAVASSRRRPRASTA
jgi:hypothetical protein